MNETNPLETQLRSWRPRQASGRLKRRLFGISLLPRAGWIAGSLVPAMACLLLTFSIYNPRPIISSAMPSNLCWSNAACVADGFADKQNHWSYVTFDSTNRSISGSTIDSFRH